MMLRKDEKINLKPEFLDSTQVDKEMDKLLEHYGTDSSLANLDKTRTILKRFGSINDELLKMRDENR